MQKIAIKELVDFRRKTDRSRKSYAYKLKTREVKEKDVAGDENDGSGGDY